MPLTSIDQTKADQFFSDIAPFADAYRYAEIRYMAVRGRSDFRLLVGVVELSAFRPAVVRGAFTTADVICETRDLRDLQSSPQAILHALLSGRVAFAEEQFAFPPELGGAHRAHNWPFDGSVQDSRLAAGHLVISGASDCHMYLQESHLFRQLKESDGAYESPAELAADFGLKLDYNANVRFDILAGRIAEISDNSQLDGDRLSVSLRLAGVLNPSLIKLGLVATKRDGAKTRLRAASNMIEWARAADGDWRGVFEMTQAAIVSASCMLSYAALVQHQATLAQPLHRINTLRFVHDLYDPEAKGIERLIREQKVQGRDPQKFELAVGALLAMRGLALASFDRIPGLNEAPDILAADARGNLLVVECTLDPNGENKLSQASRKALAIRQSFGERGRNDINVVAVMATPLRSEDMDSYRADAHKQRVLLWSREQLDALRRDRRPADANAFFDELMSAQTMTNLLAQMGDGDNSLIAG